MNILDQFKHSVPGCEGPIVEFSGGTSLFSDVKYPQEYVQAFGEVEGRRLINELQEANESGERIYICTTCKAIWTVKS